MIYLVGQILICLFFAAAIGLAVGWLLRGASGSAGDSATSEDWRVRAAELRQDAERQRAAAQELARRLEDAQTAYRKASRGEERLARALNDANQQRSADPEALRELGAQLKTSREQAAMHQREADQLNKALAERASRIEGLQSELMTTRSRLDREREISREAQRALPAERDTAGELKTRLEKSEARQSALEARALERDERIRDLSRALDEARRQTQDTEARLAAARKALANAGRPARAPAAKPRDAGDARARQGDLLGAVDTAPGRNDVTPRERAGSEGPASTRGTTSPPANATPVRPQPPIASPSNRSQTGMAPTGAGQAAPQNRPAAPTTPVRQGAQAPGTATVKRSGSANDGTATTAMPGVVPPRPPARPDTAPPRAPATPTPSAPRSSVPTDRSARQHSSSASTGVPDRPAPATTPRAESPHPGDADGRPPSPGVPSTRPAWLMDAPDGTPDDLKEIYGIGPVLEASLNTLGIYHFRQIAGWKPADVAWVARHIDSFPKRIVRDRWVEQARKLHDERVARR